MGVCGKTPHGQRRLAEDLPPALQHTGVPRRSVSSGVSGAVSGGRALPKGKTEAEREPDIPTCPVGGGRVEWEVQLEGLPGVGECEYMSSRREYGVPQNSFKR